VINRVSLCVIVYNEEHRIKQTLFQAARYVDEVIVVDQASTDDTIGAIWDWHASDSGNPEAIVVRDKHWGYCEPSRKVAHEASTGDWILVLDADEAVSSDFAAEMRTLDERGFKGVRLKRSLWISGEHRFTGDYQYRYYARDAVRYLDEIHTEPQPTVKEDKIYYPEYIGIYHEKSWKEQIRDEQAYESLIKPKDPRAKNKLSLNVYSKLLEEAGITPEEADEMTQEERDAAGIGAPDWARL
jgi:glycosyltransferase involved in cell wall biosynthesis